MKHPCVIYGLYCSQCDKTVRYVGQTSVGIETRLKQHLSGKSGRLVNNWISKHRECGISYVILDECFPSELDDLEIAWIELLETYHPLNSKGLNMTLGGCSKRCYVTPDSVRLKMSQSSTGKTASPEARQAISEALTGKKRGPRSDVEREKIRQGLLSSTFVVSEASKKKMSDSHRGVKLSPERVESNRKASHVRWHTNKGIVKDECIYCSKDSEVI